MAKSTVSSLPRQIPPLFSASDVPPPPAFDIQTARAVVEAFLLQNPHHINSTIGVLTTEIAFISGLVAKAYDNQTPMGSVAQTTPREILKSATPYVSSYAVIGSARRWVLLNSAALLAAYPDPVLAWRSRGSKISAAAKWRAQARRTLKAAAKANAIKTTYNLTWAPRLAVNCKHRAQGWTAFLPTDPSLT